jgi:hypothetical protein
MGTGCSYPGPGREADHSLPSTAEVRNGETIPPLSNVFMSWCLIAKLIKHGDNFTFCLPNLSKRNHSSIHTIIYSPHPETHIPILPAIHPYIHANIHLSACLPSVPPSYRIWGSRRSGYEGFPHFGGTCRLHLHGRINRAKYQLESARIATCFDAGFFLGLFDPENGGDMYLRNVGWLSTDYTTLYPRR